MSITGAGTGPSVRANARPATPVAVVIPVFNGAEHLGITLDAVLGQHYPVDEIIVVDDGSTDNSVAIASERPRVRVVRNTGKGLDQARRFGLAQTTAPLVAFLDHDDPWHADHIRLLAEALEAYPEAAAAVTHPRPFPEQGQPSFDAPALKLEIGDPWEAYPGCFTLTVAGVLMRRAAIDSVGGWIDSKGFETSGDLYMWLRLTEYGPFVVNRCATASYRVRKRSMNRHMRRERVLQYAEHIARAAEAAVDGRRARFPNEGAQLDRRALVARSIRHLVVGMVAGDSREVARGANLLEAGTAGEPEEQIRAAFDPLFWLIDGHVDKTGAEGDVWKWLVKAWPTTAQRTAPYRLRYTSLRALLVGALKRPTAQWRWTWFMEVLRRRNGLKGEITRRLHLARDGVERARPLVIILFPEMI